MLLVGLSGEDLKTRLLRGGKKILTPFNSEETKEEVAPANVAMDVQELSRR